MKESWEIHWKNYYKILQIDPSAEPEVVKAAYDRLARKYHPDLSKDATSSGRMKDLNEAFEILNHPQKRERYYAAYCQQVNPKPIIMPTPRGASAYSPRPETKVTPNTTPNVVRSDRWCEKCEKTINMKISFVDKKPAYASCPECNTYWDIMSPVHHKPNDSELTPDVKRRLEELRNKKKKRWFN